MTPIVGTIINLPPKWRFSFGAMLIFMVLPPKTPNINEMLYLLLQRYKTMFRGVNTEGTGFEVYDAYRETVYNMFFELILNIEDTQGLKNTLLCKSPGAKIGGCFMCDVVGIMYSMHCIIINQ